MEWIMIEHGEIIWKEERENGEIEQDEKPPDRRDRKKEEKKTRKKETLDLEIFGSIGLGV